ncbi:hypothetical protein OCU04_002355 [Sclerotinia nivalis]|uniref:Uncharacterized protein n=1 Tax=Sclerotinia nivalis TaxID=352851 RepID=A0A9X0AWV8_9HELO|nr:hypothetical protein OCU04_002355 [Sclerotinia nivalis]
MSAISIRRLGKRGLNNQAEISKSVLWDSGKTPNGHSVGSYLLEWHELQKWQQLVLFLDMEMELAYTFDTLETTNISY